jgi:tripartite-type tricarboxylate transporter receptor subunit TctC
VPFAPGGGTDIIARLLAQKLTENLGQSFVVENRAGAGGTVGAEAVARSPANGYTLLVVSASYSVNPSLYKLTYDPLSDLVPVSLMASVPFVLVTYPSFAPKSMAELVTLAKAKPGEVNFASSGNGSAPHLAGELLAMNTGVKMVHVPYKGGTPAITEVMAGRVQLLFSTVTQALPYIKAGQLRPLAVSSRKRATALPDVPTMEEAGIPNFDLVDWFAVLVPKGTPPAIVEKINQEVVRAVKSPDMSARLASDSFDVIGSTPAEFDRLLRKDIESYAGIVKSANVKVE